MPDNRYENFVVAVYVRAYEVEKMQDPAWREETWATISRQVKVDKIYLETHRDRIIPDGAALEEIKRFFADKGVQTAAGIALVVSESNRFETPCYTDPEDRALVRRVIEHSARHFDEIILDDFFFTNTKRDSDIASKGERSWSQFRIELMRDVARELILRPARAVNPNVRLTIKFPNWYEHFPGCGYDLEEEPRLFDRIYTGTETRQPAYNAQRLQQYESYGIVRYFENIAPGRNAGGWVDQGDARYADRYAEQLWLTMFAKAPEMTLFAYHELLRPLPVAWRGAWQDEKPTFDFDTMVAGHPEIEGHFGPALTTARVAGIALEQADAVVGKLGNPIGVAAYKPYHSTGEDFLHNYLGMIGIPMDIRPEFPTDAPTLLLTEAAKSDPKIVDRIREQLCAGKTVVITSGLLNALQDRGLRDIAEWQMSGKRFLADAFVHRREIHRSESTLLFPQVDYLTNDSWPTLTAGESAFPILLQNGYSAGMLNALVLPDDPADLYRLPPEALDAIRSLVTRDLFVHLEGPAQVCLFPYDNRSFIVESFLHDATSVQIVSPGAMTAIRDLTTGETFAGASRTIPASWHRPAETATVFEAPIKPHSFRVFLAEA